ncbi:MAG: DUF2608 domain-containing protein [Bacteriovoracaceae bacterium]|nr:DUF2608 domain-containing protein [Bacteriovoracaceae bacterium]
MKQLSLLIFLALFGLNAFSMALETDSYEQIRKTTLEKIEKYGAKNVLVVLDIDNTTLAMPQNLGSDQWFGWQSGNCMGKEKTPPFCVADNFDELLDIQGQLFALSNMIPTEKATVKVIKELQSKGIKLILLTSRGPVFRNATERALKMNGLTFRESAIGSANGFASSYTPYDLKNPKASGLNAYDIKSMGNKSPRPVSYMNGVFMTSGLNKGIMLKTLLAKTKSNFKAIIFADDHKKHTVRMQQIMGKVKGVDLVTFRYSKIDPIVKAFHASDKMPSIKAWEAIKAASLKAFK